MKTKIKGSVVIAIIAILLVAIIVGCNPDSTPPPSLSNRRFSNNKRTIGSYFGWNRG